MTLYVENLLRDLPPAAEDELVTRLARGGAFRLERIVSWGQVTPEGVWYDQDQDEWVLLLSGAADLLIEGEAMPRRLRSGDFLLLPAHRRHRVEWTDKEAATVWLALHFSAA